MKCETPAVKNGNCPTIAADADGGGLRREIGAADEQAVFKECAVSAPAVSP